VIAQRRPLKSQVASRATGRGGPLHGNAGGSTWVMRRKEGFRGVLVSLFLKKTLLALRTEQQIACSEHVCVCAGIAETLRISPPAVHEG
jgi:hypothetical protein